MTNKGHLALLRQGIEHWNRWRNEHEDIVPDLSGADLGNANLEGANLTGANLSGTNLAGANLAGSHLVGANLKNAVLSHAVFNWADLTRTDLTGAILDRTIFSETILRGANLSGLDLRLATLIGADLAKADLSSTDCSGANLSKADLSGADLREAKLRGANLSGANLSKAHITADNLVGANLKGANLSGARLSPANLRGADVSASLLDEVLAYTLGAKEIPDITDAGAVQFTAYYPRETRAYTRYSFLLYAHTEESFENVANDVEKFSDELGNMMPSPKRAKQTTQIRLNTPITVVPESDQIEFDPPSLAKKWSGEWTRFGFEFKPTQEMSGDTLFVRVSIQVATVEVAHVNCAIEVMDQKAESKQDIAEAENPLADAKLNSSTSELYHTIFISYSRKDKEVVKVYKLVQEAVGNIAFKDTDSIRAGEDWRCALAHAIDQADIFQLFWSENSAGSTNVRNEWQYALKHKCPENRCVGFIRPVCWNEPIKPSPPEELGHLNFKYVPLSDLVHP